jgi:hypothetical protein
MASGACGVLMRVAKSFLEQNSPLQAIKCLEAICLSNTTEYPEMEAEILLKVRSTARSNLLISWKG